MGSYTGIKIVVQVGAAPLTSLNFEEGRAAYDVSYGGFLASVEAIKGFMRICNLMRK
jgi:hypothetical protein